MQILIPVSRVDPQNIYFNEKRKNVILEGNFAKVLYSTADFEMNGLHILIRIKSAIAGSRYPQFCVKPHATQDTPPAKFVEFFDPASIHNATQINMLCNIENEIVNNYIQMYAMSKRALYNLKSQLTSGTFRYSVDNETANKNASCAKDAPEEVYYALKISGIWETECNVGITAKYVRL